MDWMEFPCLDLRDDLPGPRDDDSAVRTGDVQPFHRAVNLHPRQLAETVYTLHVAANVGHVECMKAILRDGANVGEKDSYGWLPLHHAASSFQYNAMTILLDEGSDVNARGPLNQTPLHLCAKGRKTLLWSFHKDYFTDLSDSPKCCEILLARGADVNAVNNYNRTPLYEAIVHRNAKVVEVLVKGGADPLQCADNGVSALHFTAIHCGDNPDIIIDCLVAKGWAVNARSDEGSTPLISAVNTSNTKAMLALLQHGADVNISNYSGESPLHFAASDGYLKGLHILLKAGADVNARNSDGETPVHKAASLYPEILKTLVAAGGDMEASTEDGCTPLHYAAEGVDAGSLDVCVELGVNLQARDHTGWTAMHYAAVRGRPKTMEWLSLRAVSDPALSTALGVDARTYDGDTPLHAAAEAGKVANVTWLLLHGAPLNAVDDEGQSALHAAAVGTCPVTMRALLEGARGCARVRWLRDVHGQTAADIANPELQRILKHWGIAG